VDGRAHVELDREARGFVERGARSFREVFDARRAQRRRPDLPVGGCPGAWDVAVVGRDEDAVGARERRADVVDGLIRPSDGSVGPGARADALDPSIQIIAPKTSSPAQEFNVPCLQRFLTSQ